MTWARLDDGFHSHPKVKATSLAGRGLFATAIAYSAQHLTDGFLREQVMLDMARLRHGRAALRELVEHELLDRVEGGYAIHDFLDYNPSRADVQAGREGAKERQRRKRQRDRQGSLPWDGSPTPVTRESQSPVTPGREGRGEPPPQNDDESHAHAPGVVGEVMAVLRRCKRFVFAPQLDAQIESAIAANRDMDPLVAAHEAVVSGSDPAYRTTDAGRAFMYAIRRVPPGQSRPASQTSAAPAQNLGQRRERCPDCLGAGYVFDDDLNAARPCQCRTAGAAA